MHKEQKQACSPRRNLLHAGLRKLPRQKGVFAGAMPRMAHSDEYSQRVIHISMRYSAGVHCDDQQQAQRPGMRTAARGSGGSVLC